MNLEAGRIVGERYRIVRLLGAGGIGAVYEAENLWTQRRVAIKVLQARVSDNADIVRRFTLEARAATALRHPNIVDVLDMGPDASTGALFLVQELLQGADLRARLDAASRLSAPVATRLLLPVMDALAVAHRAGILHRDIKPENIFLAVGAKGEEVPKLIDFGLSKVLNPESVKDKTRTGTVMGTPQYMSPEQARGESALDDGTDVWAVGVVLFEALSGQVPFDGENVNALLWKVMSEPVPLLSAVAPWVPAGVAAVVQRALERDRSRRWPTMESFAAALRASVESAPEALPVRGEDLANADTLLASPGATQRPTPLGWSSDERRVKRPWKSRGALAAGALVAAVLLSIWWVPRHGPAPHRTAASPTRSVTPPSAASTPAPTARLTAVTPTPAPEPVAPSAVQPVVIAAPQPRLSVHGHGHRSGHHRVPRAESDSPAPPASPPSPSPGMLVPFRQR